MLHTNGKFLIYTPRFSAYRDRQKVVELAVARVAERVRIDVEVTKRTKLLSVYVYYRDGRDEEIPIYCDWGKDWSEDEVCHAIRSVMFTLSFHPKHSALRAFRKELCAFS